MFVQERQSGYFWREHYLKTRPPSTAFSFKGVIGVITSLRSVRSKGVKADTLVYVVTEVLALTPLTPLNERAVVSPPHIVRKGDLQSLYHRNFFSPTDYYPKGFSPWSPPPSEPSLPSLPLIRSTSFSTRPSERVAPDAMIRISLFARKRFFLHTILRNLKQCTQGNFSDTGKLYLPRCRRNKKPALPV